MRHFLSLILLILCVLPLTGCCGEGLGLRSPFETTEAKPKVVPTAWGVVQPTTYSVVQPIQQVQLQYAQPYAAPCVPSMPQTVQYSSGYQYAAPPAGCVPGVR